jgi:hypothetical protein
VANVRTGYFGQRANIQDSGTYRIYSNVSRLGLFGVYRVRLFDRRSGRLVRETWSASSGSYLFDYIAYFDKGYFVMAFDHSAEQVNAAVSDLLTPVPMP